MKLNVGELLCHSNVMSVTPHTESKITRWTRRQKWLFNKLSEEKEANIGTRRSILCKLRTDRTIQHSNNWRSVRHAVCLCAIFSYYSLEFRLVVAQCLSHLLLLRWRQQRRQRQRHRTWGSFSSTHTEILTMNVVQFQLRYDFSNGRT